MRAELIPPPSIKPLSIRRHRGIRLRPREVAYDNSGWHEDYSRKRPALAVGFPAGTKAQNAIERKWSAALNTQGLTHIGNLAIVSGSSGF